MCGLACQIHCNKGTSIHRYTECSGIVERVWGSPSNSKRDEGEGKMPLKLKKTWQGQSSLEMVEADEDEERQESLKPKRPPAMYNLSTRLI